MISFATCTVLWVVHSLGDRHGDNILIDKNTGDVVHIDFDCLFEKVETNWTESFSKWLTLVRSRVKN